VDKSNGKIRYLKTIGVSSNEETIAVLYRQGKEWIADYDGSVDMFVHQARMEEEKELTEHLLSNVENILLNGTQLILNRVFKTIGFDAVDDEILKHLVISRLCQPSSKTGTVEYLKSYFDEDLKLHKIYRYLDKVSSSLKEAIQQISVEHTQKILGGRIGLVFYDVTTLYFETDTEDDLRKPGFSKDGKHMHPQVVLGLLVSVGGYPLAYSINEGNKYEGHTMLPVVEDFVKKFNLKDFVVVADSGLMNNDNIEILEGKNYKYILGARIKCEKKAVADWILSQKRLDGTFYEYGKPCGRRLIVSYSEKRAKKDAYNRKKGLGRLEKEYRNGSLTKGKINKRGYNRFLEIENKVSVRINYEKIKDDERWDGFKGYITNTTLPSSMVYEQYRDLWQIEHAFRVSKGALGLRPIFHFTPKRIDAHVCICFVAYKVYKELQRILKMNGIGPSVDKVLSIAKTITTLKIKLPVSGKTIYKTMLLTEKQKTLSMLFDEEFWKCRLGVA